MNILDEMKSYVSALICKVTVEKNLYEIMNSAEKYDV